MKDQFKKKNEESRSTNKERINYQPKHKLERRMRPNKKINQYQHADTITLNGL